MAKKKYIYFLDNDMWLGYWEEFPDYMTQGETLEELKSNLKDIYYDISGNYIPCVRHVGEMEIAWKEEIWLKILNVWGVLSSGMVENMTGIKILLQKLVSLFQDIVK